MILDWDLYNKTSFGSAKKILCSCDGCGVHKLVAKQHLVNRNGYKFCSSCSHQEQGKKRIGHKFSEEFKKNISNARKGKPIPSLTDDQKKNSKRNYIVTKCVGCNSESLRRKDQVLRWSGYCRNCNSKIVSNLPHVLEIRKEVGRRVMAQNGHNVVKRGENHPMWRGGISTEVELIRNSKDLREWRQAVYARDNFTCQICSERGGKLHADHIKPFSLFPELRTDINNGRTLCVSCHKKHGARVWRGRWVNEPKDFATV